MNNPSTHPMDEFPVRPLAFDFREVEFGDPLWSRTSPQFAMFVNALGIHVPYFERYLVRTMRAVKPHLNNERLQRDVGAIIGQEAHHAKNFIALNGWLAKRYPKAAKFDADARDWFGRRAKQDSLKRLVGFTAGYETFTFLGGMIVLDNFERWFKDSDRVFKALWIWHQVEEVEHGAVAFDVYQALYGKHEWYRKWMILVTLLHIAKETSKAYYHMSKVEGWFRNPLKGMWRMGFCYLMLGRFVKAALPVFRRGYHPRKHPLVTTRQNPIQIAWRRYETGGGDVLQIDHTKMAQIMSVPLAT